MFKRLSLSPDPELYNEQDVRDAIATASSAVDPLREWIKHSQTVLTERFRKNVAVTALMLRRAWLIDCLLHQVWSLHQWSDEVEIALVAVGGYGRGVLHLHSDIDLLLLFELPEHIEIVQQDIQAFVATLWDIGLEVGHSVRSLEECVTKAKEDVSIATNLMEARLLEGSEALLHRLLQVVNSDTLWSDKAFFRAKCEEQKWRHRKHNNTEYNLEPNIKSAPGGLRDIQSIAWVVQKHFGERHLEDLIQYDFLTKSEYALLDSAQNFLWKLRYALHVLTGRDENRLLFEHQKTVARLLGYQDSESNKAVEQMMKSYYRVAIAISELNDMLIQHFEEDIVKTGVSDVVKPLTQHFQMRNRSIEVTSADVFERHPSALLEVFVLIAQTPEIEEVRASTIRLIRNHRDLINKDFRNDAANKRLFMRLLRSPHRLFTQLRRMKRYGILSRYIPAFGHIIGQMQYDLFHIYTVDAHTLYVVRNIRIFLYSEMNQEFPIAAKVIHQIPQLELLYLAALFHDMAKGRGGDHSTLGAEDARAFCLHHELDHSSAELVAWLVQYHLLMSTVAQKKDLSDPDVIVEFAAQVVDVTRLDYLYLLTVADICGTNPKLWNAWRAALLAKLYEETRRALRRGLSNPIQKQERIVQARSKALTLLRNMGLEDVAVLSLWSQLDDDYFLQESPEDIAWHTQAIIKEESSGEILVLTKEPDSKQKRNVVQIFIYTKDRPNLFLASVATLGQLGFTIIGARIITSRNGISQDTYLAIDPSRAQAHYTSGELEQVKLALHDTLVNLDSFVFNHSVPVPRQLKNFKIKTQVSISNDLNKQKTVVDIITLDRPGLLVLIAAVFQNFNLDVQTARVVTFGERAEDIFEVTAPGCELISSDPRLCEKLRKTLCEQLDQKD